MNIVSVCAYMVVCVCACMLMCVCVFLSFRGVSFSAGLNLFLWLSPVCYVCVCVCESAALTVCVRLSACSWAVAMCLEHAFGLLNWMLDSVCGCTFVSLYFASFVEYILGENAGRPTLPVSPFATVIWLCTPWNRRLDSEKCSVYGQECVSLLLPSGYLLSNMDMPSV